jgi:hypothetical protein
MIRRPSGLLRIGVAGPGTEVVDTAELNVRFIATVEFRRVRRCAVR